MKYTILHLTPTLEGGGAERQLAMLAFEQAHRQWDVHVAMRRGGVHEDILRNSEVKIHNLGDYRRLSPKLVLHINSLIRKIKPDLVQTWLPQMDILGGAVCLFNGVPWILSERVSELAFQKLKGLAWLRRGLGRHANAIIANSMAGRKYWVNILPKNTIACTISNAVDIAAIRNVAPSNCELVNKNKKLILVVGRLTEQKSIETIIRSISLITDRKDFQVLIIGNGPLKLELEFMVRKLKLDKDILILPYQSDWWGLLKVADMLVSMSLYEGQPNVILETMAAGCPLIVSDIPEHRELLDDNSAILVQVKNAVKLSEAVNSLLDDPYSAHVRAQNAVTSVRGLMISSVADAYESVYKKVVSR